MTDTEGTEARRSDGEETQFIQPVRDYGRAETKPRVKGQKVCPESRIFTD